MVPSFDVTNRLQSYICIPSQGPLKNGRNTQLLHVENFQFKEDPVLGAPFGLIFGRYSFMILKNWHQDLSNEGSKGILSSLSCFL